MKNEKYSKACVEVNEILKYLQEQDKCKIPQDFIDMLNKNMDNLYVFNFDNTKTIEEQDILRETKILLAYIYLNYLGTEEEKAFYEQKFSNDILNLDKVLQNEKTRIFFF